MAIDRTTQPILQVDRDRFRTLCEDAKLRWHETVLGDGKLCIAIEGGPVELLSFVLTVAPDLDPRFETVGSDLDFDPNWLAVAEIYDPRHLYAFPGIRPVNPNDL